MTQVHDENISFQALKILCLAADKYLEGADELAISFIAPQVNAAKSILNDLIVAHFTVASDETTADTKTE